MEPIIRNPKNIKALGLEIRKVCDAYWKGEIKEGEAKKYIIYWSANESKKLFKGSELNPTIKLVIGKSREELLLKWLSKENKA